MQYQFYPANERGTKDLGWLQSKFSFSFSSYQHPTKKSFGLLHTFNDDLVKPGGGFGLHAHVNMEIISVMLAGTMNHKDSMGYSEVVEKDWVQIMSAGAGLRRGKVLRAANPAARARSVGLQIRGPTAHRLKP